MTGSNQGESWSGDLTGLDGPVRRLLERIAAPAAATTPDLDTIGAALMDLAADRDYVSRWVDRVDSDGGSVAIHVPSRGPRLFIVHRPTGQMGAVHDHRTWVAISSIVGSETHRRYRISPNVAAIPELVETRTLNPDDVFTMLPPDDVHDHGHLAGTGAAAYVLILTGDDQTRYPRNEWDLATGRHRVLPVGDPGRWLASEPFPSE